jgi:hypothetical protein
VAPDVERPPIDEHLVEKSNFVGILLLNVNVIFFSFCGFNVSTRGTEYFDSKAADAPATGRRFRVVCQKYVLYGNLDKVSQYEI